MKGEFATKVAKGLETLGFILREGLAFDGGAIAHEEPTRVHQFIARFASLAKTIDEPVISILLAND
jgi:hypothetical protein